MENKTKQKIIRKRDRIIKSLKYRIKMNGYEENLGQKEAREYNDWLGKLMTEDKISYPEMAKYSGEMLEVIYQL